MSQQVSLLEAVKQNAKEQDGRLVLPCPEAFSLAKAYSVDLGKIGQCCNELNIKIVQCQLGCFR